MAPPRVKLTRERDSSPRRPALTSAERVRLHRERVRLRRAQEPQPPTSVAASSGVRQSRLSFDVTMAAVKVENETSSSTTTRIQATPERVRLGQAQESQPSTSGVASSGVRQSRASFDVTMAAIKVENETSSSTTATNQATPQRVRLGQAQEPQPFTDVAGTSGVRQQAAGERDSGPRRPALTSAERVRLHRERIRLRQMQEPQPSTNVAESSGLKQSQVPFFDATMAAVKVKNETSSSISNTKSQATPERVRLSQAQKPQPFTDVAGTSGVRQQAAGDRDSGPRRPALTSAERVRLHRQRIRLRRAQEPQPSTSVADTSWVRQQQVARERDSGPRRPALTSAERVRLHRQRVKLRQAQELQNSAVDSSGVRQSRASFSDITMGAIKVENETSSSTSTARSQVTSDTKPQLEQITRSPDYHKRWNLATARFKTVFMENEFGHKCDVCDRLWFKKDLKSAVSRFLEEAFPGENKTYFKLCRNCLDACKRRRMPAMSKSNGYRYPPYPTHLPKLGPIEERLVSPRLPYLQIRRLRHAGQYGIVGQVINIPVDANNMVKTLPRQLDDDYAINVNIKRSLIHKSSYLSGSVDKEKVKAWLQYLTNKPLYKHYNIGIDWERLEHECPVPDPSTPTAEVEEAVIEPFDCTREPESEIRNIQQHTMVWNEPKCLDNASGQCVSPVNIIYDRHAEELSFPTIYLGEARQIAEGVKDTPYTMCMSEIRRSDRRGVTPQHVLYMAMGILRRRVTEGIYNTFRFSPETNNITRKQIEDRDFVEQLVETNTDFLKTIPNSVQYWAGRKRDLFAMIRQLGKPTAFMTLSANEAHWPHLLRILHKWNPAWHAQYGSDITENDIMEKMHPYNRHYLVAEDPVICCVYFYKLVTCLLTILSSERTYNPFGRYRVVDFFLRIEFQNCSSPQAHILLWLANDPKEPLSENMPLTINLLTDLCSVDKQDLPDEALLYNQTHTHTLTCFKQDDEKCRFGIPFWPMPETRILLPLAKEETRQELYKSRVKNAREKLVTNSYDSFDAYLVDIGSYAYDDYLQLLRSTLHRPTVFFKRDMSQIYINTFNPWIAATLQSYTDFQLILDSHSCAAYLVDYVHKSNRGFSDFHRQLLELYKRDPQADYTGLMKTLTLQMLNSVEISAQEAAWFLLRQPMSWASRVTVAIPTMVPHERHRASSNLWSNNIIKKYEERPQSLETVTLAQFVAWYDMRPSTHGAGGDDVEQVFDDEDRDLDTQMHLDADADDRDDAGQRANTRQSVDPARRRKICRVIKYRTYDIIRKMDQYKREQVLLHLPFRNEHADIMDCNKYLQTYTEREEEIIKAKREFEADIDTTQLLALVAELCAVEDEEKTVDAATNDAPADVRVDPLQ